MKYRSFPFVEYLAGLPEEQRRAERIQAMYNLVRMPGFQLVLDALQNVEREHLQRLTHYERDASRDAGGLAACQAIRLRLETLYRNEQPPPEIEEAGDEEEYLEAYESPFLLPPSSASPVSEG